MPLSETGVIVRLYDWFAGPLKVVPNPHRRVIANGVVRGRAVEDQTDAPVAIAYALWWGRWNKWAAIAFTVIGLTQIVLTAILRNWFQFGTAVIFVGIGALYAWTWVRIRRSVPLNEAIAH